MELTDIVRRFRKIIAVPLIVGSVYIGKTIDDHVNVVYAQDISQQQIVFEGKMGSLIDLYVINPDGTGEVNLTRDNKWESDPTWSPDRTQIVFCSYDLKSSEVVDNPYTADFSPELFLYFDTSYKVPVLVDIIDDTGIIDKIIASDNPEEWKNLLMERDKLLNFKIDSILETVTQEEFKLLSRWPREKFFFGELSREGFELLVHNSSIFRIFTHVETQLAAPSLLLKDYIFDTNTIGLNWEIYVMSSNGSDRRNLTNHPALDMHPTWSPDGTKIAFVSQRDLNREIYIINADGTGLYNLTNHPALDTMPNWSPDGRNIVFTSSRDDDMDIYIIPIDKSYIKKLTNNEGNDSAPAWSPDGTRIVFHSDINEKFGYTDIYVMDSNGNGLTRLTESKYTDAYPSWSPDGSMIAFSSWRDGNGGLYVMNADGTNQRKMTQNVGKVSYPSWSTPVLKPTSVSPQGKTPTLWGRLKQAVNY